ncbi:MAG: PTS fructose transporter subunit IIABC [Metamycoplasmataceae bacterium]
MDLKNLILKIFFDNESRNKKEALIFLSNKAVELNIISKKHLSNLITAFENREKESTTGFEEGFAIPHARISGITKPAIIFLKTEDILDWQSMDDEPIRYIFALLIPEKNENNLHIEYLSKLATLLMQPDFKYYIKNENDPEILKNYIYESITSNEDQSKEQNNYEKGSSTYRIVGVSACATGVAHTYMAKTALEESGLEDFSVKIETQGQKGAETVLSEQDIEEADAVVIASDIYVELDRFEGKRLIQIKTNDAISNPEKWIRKSLEGPVYKPSNGSLPKKSNQIEEFKSSKLNIFMKHLLSGVSRMIPFIVFSGIVWAIINSVGSIPGVTENPAYGIVKKVSEVGFVFFIAIMGGFIAESIAGRAGLAVGMMTTFVAASPDFYFWWNMSGVGSGIPQIESFFGADTAVANVGLSLFAAIMMGFASGYLVKWVNTFKTHKLVIPLMPIIFIPVVCTSIIAIPFVFLLSGPLGYLMNGLVFGLSEAAKINGVNFLIGLILGMMIGFDMGGPVNKIAGTTATALIVVDPRLMGAVAAAIPIAPLGCGVATLLARKAFNDKERAEGITALGLGFFGISEGAIPFATKRPKEVLIANLIGSGFAGGLAFLFFVGGYVGMWGGPITAIVAGVKAPVAELNTLGVSIPVIFGGAGGGAAFVAILWFFLAIIAASLLHAFIFITLMKVFNNTNPNEKKLDVFKNVFKNIFKKENKKNKIKQNNFERKLSNYYNMQNYYASNTLNKFSFLQTTKN